MRLILVVFSVVCLSAIAASQDDKSKPVAENKSAKPNGTEQSPFVIKVLPSLQAETDADKQRKEREETAQLDRKLVNLTDDLARYTSDLATFTKLLFVIGAIQAGILFWQGKQLRLTVDTAVIEGYPALFPYVIDMEQLHMVIEKGGSVAFNGAHDFPSRILFSFENFGKTPALIRKVQADMFLTLNDSLPQVEWEKLPEVHHQEVIAGGITRKELSTMPCADLPKTFKWTAQELMELNAASSQDHPFRRIFFVGVVIYDDLYGMRHTSHFCRKFRLAEGIRFQGQHGGMAYNNTKRSKKPKQNDPLDNTPEAERV